MSPSAIGLLVLIIGVPLNLLVVVRLRLKLRADPQFKVLRERLVAARAVLLLVVVFGLIFVNNDTIPPPLDLATTKLITRLTMLGVAVVPAAYWLWIYRKLR